MGIHLFITLFLLSTGCWVSFALNVPLMAFNIWKVVENKHLVDATEIFQNLSFEKKVWGFRLGFYLFSLFYYLFMVISTLIKESGPRTAGSFNANSPFR
ncbi:hypothetical protein DSO57_1026461 [Entomophthora muscae]|uniref:Uncharacterized protein n=1 Tax=Entomophthora muscae TaxID=34485 RepID=A0ACC2TZY6_9FUNG|nr:hypothetical protein DSO57_1026461 [Entomophthora muscae]